jgi:hypothetical protein
MIKSTLQYLSLPLLLIGIASGCASQNTDTEKSLGPRSPASEIAVKIMFDKASELLSLVNKVDGVNFRTAECGNGQCFEEGSILLICVTANNGNPHSRASRNDPKNSCDVKANKLRGKKTKLIGKPASDLANLANSASGLGEKTDVAHTCDSAHCLTKGVLHIACKYPDKVNSERETICHVTSGPYPLEVD